MLGRRKKHQTEIDSREMLLRTAERLFAEHGYDAVSTRMIRKESGVNIAMISYYFGSKDGLFHALIEEKVPQMREKLELLRDSDVSNWEKISRTIELYVERLFKHIGFTKLMSREMSMSQRPENCAFISRHIHVNMEIILGFIKAGIEKGEFQEIDPEMTLNTLFGAIFQWINMSAVGMKMFHIKTEEEAFQPEYRERLVAHLKDLMRKYLLK